MHQELIASNSEARIYRATDTGGRRCIIKESENSFLLQSEARMLEYLKPFIRVPELFRLDARALEMEYIPHNGQCNAACEAEIADLLAKLHRQSAPFFGFDADTTIGPFRQSNRRHGKWIDFYREERVRDFALKAFQEGAIDRELLQRIERFAEQFEHYLSEPEHPSLLHGDIWSGNVLTRDNRFAALIDPALYYGHYEMELAFIGMFHTFGAPFYRRYGEHLPLDNGFFETRAPIYRLFPYLVHVRAFGSGYIRGLEGILEQFDY